MGLHLRVAAPADIPGLCEVFFDAFSEHEITRSVFPSDSASSLSFWHKSFTREMQDPQIHLLVVTDASSQTPDTVVGCARWMGPKSSDGLSSSTAPEEELPWPEGADIGVAEEFFGILGRKHEELMAGRQHWYLDLIGVRKEWQGKGAAGEMLRWGLAKADEDGLECYLSASPAGAPIYRKYGFKDVELITFTRITQADVAMIRPRRDLGSSLATN